MLDAQNKRRSGIYDVQAEGAHTLVYFAKGKVVFAEQGTLGDSLGRVLVREGKLTTAQYTQAIRRMTERLVLVESEQMRFGEVVVELGFLTRADIHEALATQVRTRAIRCLTYDESQWTFEELSEGLSGVGHFPATVEPLILSATKLFEVERIERILQMDQERYPWMLQEADGVALAFKMNPHEQRFVEQVDGTSSLQMLLGRKHPGLDDPSAVLAALILSGAVELSPRPKLQARVPVRAAVPDVVPAPQVVPRAVRVRLKGPPVVSVPTPPSEIMSPIPTDPHSARLVAEDAFQRGKALLRSATTTSSWRRANSLSLALPKLQRAAQVCPDAMEFVLYVKWAEFLLCVDENEQTTLRSALKQLATKAVKQDPNLAFGFFVLGNFAAAEGDEDRQLRFFRHALKLDPELREAERHLRLLQMRGGRPAVSPPRPAEEKPVPKVPVPLRAAAAEIPPQRLAPRSRFLVLVGLGLIAAATAAVVIATR